MKNKKILLILCFIILLLSLNSISATAENDTAHNNIQKVNENNNIKQEQSNIVYVDTSSQSNMEDGSKNNPYKTINNKNIEKIASDTIVHVAKGTYNLNSTSINKDITIIGDNQKDVIFTSTESTSIFTIQKGTKVVFKNFTIRDFTSSTNAAITNNGTLELEKMKLYNNVGTTGANNGGSILNNGNLHITDSTFKKNMASFGAAIYSTCNVTIKNSSFIDNSIYNVGGAIYSASGNLTVHDSYFTQNRAVSGAAIYNAFGYLNVNNTRFYENDAEYFFGGAIYSTGITITNNSIFDSNHASKDGGAITTTSNFTIINCVFNENFANENGGAIENVPWTEKENGNLTIINSTFTENTATLGGVIINYGKKEASGDPATVTARNCLFDSNTADLGGVIYNEQYVDMQNNVFVDNEADECNIIYTIDDKLIKSLDNNWWSTNNPTKEDIGFMPRKWFVMNFTNTTGFYTNKKAELKVSLNTLNDGKILNKGLPLRRVTFNATNSTFKHNSMTIIDFVKNSVQSFGDNITARIDYQILSLQPADAPKDVKITINPITKVCYKDNINVTGKLTDINNKIIKNSVLKVKINNKSVNIKTNGSGEYSYRYKVNNVGKNKLTVSYSGNSKYAANSTSITFKVNKKDVSLKFYPIRNVSFKDNVTVSGKFVDGSGHALLNSNVRLSVNGRDVVVKTGKKGIFNYTFKATHVGVNRIVASYPGNSNYGKNSTSISFNVTRKQVKILLNSIKTVNYKENVIVTGKFMDGSGHALLNSNVKLSVNGMSVIVNTGKKGIFSYRFKAFNTGVNKLTASFAGNKNYLKTSNSTNFSVKKQDLRISVNKIKSVVQGNRVKITGKLTDRNNHALMNSNIKIKVNNISVIVKTSNAGIFSYTYKTSMVGTNKVRLGHDGNRNYNKCSVNTTFVVKKK